jgi:hypothetical protein
MKLTVYRSFQDGGLEEYHLMRETGSMIARESLDELLDDLKKLAVEARQNRQKLSVSFTSDENIVQYRRGPVLIQQSLSTDEQRKVWEMFKSIPIPD